MRKRNLVVTMLCLTLFVPMRVTAQGSGINCSFRNWRNWIEYAKFAVNSEVNNASFIYGISL